MTANNFIMITAAPSAFCTSSNKAWKNALLKLPSLSSTTYIYIYMLNRIWLMKKFHLTNQRFK